MVKIFIWGIAFTDVVYKADLERTRKIVSRNVTHLQIVLQKNSEKIFVTEKSRSFFFYIKKWQLPIINRTLEFYSLDGLRNLYCKLIC